MAPGAFEEGDREPLAGPNGAGERDLVDAVASGIQYTAGSGPQARPFDQFVNGPGPSSR